MSPIQPCHAARRPRFPLVSCSFLLATIGAACGGGTAIDDAAAGQIGLARQALAGYGTGEWGGPVDYWDQNGYDVPVCYLHNPSNTGSEAGYFSEFIAANAEVVARHLAIARGHGQKPAALTGEAVGCRPAALLAGERVGQPASLGDEVERRDAGPGHDENRKRKDDRDSITREAGERQRPRTRRLTRC